MADITSDFLPQKRKSRRGCLPALIIVTLLAVIILCVVFYLGTLGVGVERRFRAGLKQLKDGALAMQAGMNTVGSLSRAGADPERRRRVDQARKLIKKADKNFNAADHEFRQMRRQSIFNWEKKTASLMLLSVKERRAALAGFRQEVNKIEDIAEILDNVSRGAVKFKQAVDKSNKLIVLNNSGRFADVKQAAPQVVSLYKEAEKLIGAAEKSASGTGLVSYENRVALGEELAARLNLMADSGLKQNWPEYNRLKNEVNDILGRLVKTSKSPLINNPRAWVDDRFKQLSQEVNRRLDRSEKFRKKGLDLWEKNT